MHRPILVVLNMVLGGHAVVKWEVGKCRMLSVKARSAGLALDALVERSRCQAVERGAAVCVTCERVVQATSDRVSIPPAASAYLAASR